MARVTEVEKVRKHIEAVIDGERLHIAYSCFRERPLEVGQEIDLTEYKNFLLLRQYKPALTYATDRLAAKGYAEKELERTLVRGGYLPETAEMVVLKLHQLSFLNDQTYAETYIESHAASGHGQTRIAQDLRRKGIDPDLVKQALENADQDIQHEAADQLVRKGYLRRTKGEALKKTEQRILGTLLRRGYTYEEAHDAIDRVREEMADVLEEDIEEPDSEEQILQAMDVARRGLMRDTGDPRKDAQRVLGMLARRGFSYDIAKEALRRIHEEEE